MSLATYPCPRCQQATHYTDNPNRPFCSERCKLIDFGAWADEAYRLPTQDSPSGEERHASRDEPNL